MTAARFTPGAISLASSTHFPPVLYSKKPNPVALPPGRAKLSTKPLPTGSETSVNTIGIVRVACCKDANTPPPIAKTTSGASRPLQPIRKDLVIRFRRQTTGEGGNHGCEGDFGKEVCCEAERRGTRTA